MALAGRVIASHYAEPLPRVVARPAALRARPSEDADIVCDLTAGETFALLDDSVGWAWGYAGADGRVGYLKSEALGPA